MSATLFIAKRYLKASRRAGFVSFITGFSILGVTIGTAAVIVALSIISGFEKEIKEKVFSFTSHVQVTGFQNQPLYDYQNSLKRVRENVSAVRAIAPYVGKEAMIRAGERVDGIFLKGIDPENELNVTRRYLVDGRFLSSGETGQAVVIGKKLAGKLGVAVGDRVVIFGLPRRGAGDVSALQPRAMQFDIAGIFESGMAEYDDLYVYTTIQLAQKLFEIDDNAVLGFDIALRDVNDAVTVASDVQRLLGYPHYARTVAQLYRNLFAWIELQKKPAPILLGLIIIVATVNIIGAILMLVLDKAHGIGVLKSIGATRGQIRNVFLLQGAFIGVAGVLLGNILAYVLCSVQLTFAPFSLPSDIYFMSSVPVLLRVENFLLVTAVVFFLCIVAALLPSHAASKLDPIITLRFG